MEEGAALIGSNSGRDAAEGEKDGWSLAVEEGKRMGYVAAPFVVVVVAQYLVFLLSTMMVGHLGELALASTSMAYSFSSVTGFSLLLGLAGGLETLCGQAYGARQYQNLGTYMYRAMLCLLLICIPISILWLNLGKIFELMHQDPEISHEAEKFAVRLIPALFAFAFSQSLTKFLQAQSLIFPMLFSAVAVLCIHVPICWVLVFKCGMGATGAALAISVSSWLNAMILGLYVMYSSSCDLTRALPSMEVFHGIPKFLRIALPSALMICLEWWSFEFLVLLSGLLPNPELETSVLSICLNTISTLYAFPYGVGAAASTRISNELGAGNAQRARVAVQVAVLIASTEAFIVSITLFLLRHVFGYAFSNEKEVIVYVTKISPLLALSVVMDSLQGVLSGIARGCGWQHLGAYVNLSAFYIVGIPMASLLGFWFQLRGLGLWIGILAGSIVQTTLLALITSFTSWEKQVKDARKRLFGEDSLAQDLLK